MKHCQECFFLVPDKNSLTGVCHRFPKSVGVQDVRQHWCGEYKHPTDERARIRLGNLAIEDPGFAHWYAHYPRKVGRSAAYREWRKQRIDPATVDAMLAKLAQQKEGWKEPQYIPHPTTYLSQRRWEDETTAAKERNVTDDVKDWLEERTRGPRYATAEETRRYLDERTRVRPESDSASPRVRPEGADQGKATRLLREAEGHTE